MTAYRYLRMLGALCVALLSMTAIAALQVGGTAPAWAAASTWGPGAVFQGSTGVNGSNSSLTQSVSCSSAKNCTAVGTDASGQAAYVTETDGYWGSITAVPNPDDVDLNSTMFSSVSCTDALDCTAVGLPRSGDFNTQPPIFSTETAGVWGPLQTLTGPAPAAGGELRGVSCSDANDCTAIGGYYVPDPTPPDYSFLPFYVSETNGVWGAPSIESSVPLGSDFSGVSCVDPTDCVAVGWEDTVASQQSTRLPMYATESGGTWASPTEISGVSPGVDQFTSVDCSSLNMCTAVGAVGNSSLYATDTGGTWSPAEVGAAGSGIIEGISCTDAIDCTGVGGASNAYVYTETGGTWNSPINVCQQPFSDSPIDCPNPNGGIGYSLFNDVSCSSVTACTAVGAGGFYYPSGGDSTWDFYDTSPATAVSIAAPPSLPDVAGTVTYTVTVLGSGPPPTGSVTLDDGTPGSCGPLNSGVAMCTETEAASAAPYTVTAVYSGDSNYDSSSATTSVDSAVSSGGSATASNGGITASAGPGGTDGTDTVTVAPYSSDPVGTLSDGSGYFDVNLSSNNTFDGATIADCNASVTSSTVLSWWNPQGGTGTGAWQPVMGSATDTTPPYGQTYDGLTNPPCISATINGGSSPGVTDLTGTVFAQSIHGGSVLPHQSTGLIGNAVDTLSGTGWNVNGDTSVDLYECTTETQSAHCSGTLATATVATAPLSKVGHISTSVSAATGTIDGSGDTCGVSGSPQCYLVATGSSGDTTAVPIGFALPTVTVTKTLGVLGNYVEKVTAKYFPIGDTINAFECDSGVSTTNLAQNCDSSTQISGTAGTKGTVIFSPSGVTMLVDGAYSDIADGNGCDSTQTCVVAATDSTNAAVTALSGSIGFASPTATVTKTTGVLGNYVDKVTAKDFPIGATVEAEECDSAVTSANLSTNCDGGTLISGTAGPTGDVTFSPPGVSMRVDQAYFDTANGNACETIDTCRVMVFSAPYALVLGEDVHFAAPSVSVPLVVPIGNGKTLTVKGSDFPIGDTIEAVECDSVFTGDVADNCDAATTIEGTAGPTGAVTFSPTKMTVLTNDTSSRYSDATSGSCQSGGPTCYVATNDGSDSSITFTSPFNVG